MTLLDRMLVAVIRYLLGPVLGRRFNQAKGRVFWWNVESIKPWRLRRGGYGGKRCAFNLGFGSEGNIATLIMTREQAEILRDGLIEGLELQDRQYAIVEEE
jgi:hypothetical protein